MELRAAVSENTEPAVHRAPIISQTSYRSKPANFNAANRTGEEEFERDV